MYERKLGAERGMVCLRRMALFLVRFFAFSAYSQTRCEQCGSVDKHTFWCQDVACKRNDRQGNASQTTAKHGRCGLFVIDRVLRRTQVGKYGTGAERQIMCTKINKPNAKKKKKKVEKKRRNGEQAQGACSFFCDALNLDISVKSQRPHGYPVLHLAARIDPFQKRASTSMQLLLRLSE